MNEFNIEKNQKDIRNAWIAGIVSAALTLIYAVIGTYNENFRFKYGIDVWSFLDVAFILILVYGIYRKKRLAAIVMFCYFLLSKIIIASETGHISGALIGLLFSYFYFMGIVGTIQYHKFLLHTGAIEKKKVTIKKKLIIGSVSGLVILLLFLIYLRSQAPGTEVVPGRQIKEKFMTEMRSMDLIEPDENILYFYSDAFHDIKDGFYFFSDQKVVVYSQTFDQPEVRVSYDEIVDIEFNRDESFWSDSYITLILNDESTVWFPVSSENGGDLKYYNTLKRIWKKKTSL